MLCIKCNNNPITKHNKIRWCNSCYVKTYKKARPGYASCGINGYKTFKRDGFICQSCKRNEKELKQENIRLEIHHLDGKGSGRPTKERNNSLANLITLCRICHYAVEILRRGNANKGLNGRWAYHYDRCISCGTKSTKHMGHGLCITCTERKRRQYKANWYQKRKLLTP